MSNETVSKPRTRRSPAEGTSTAAERPAAEVSETTKKPVVPKEIDPNQIITVRNGFQGRLVYKSKRTGERWSWESFGAEQDMELSELKTQGTPTRNISSTTGSCLMRTGLSTISV